MMINMEQPLLVVLALLNALEIAEKKIDEVKIVVSGAGASAISCAKLYESLGARKGLTL